MSSKPSPYLAPQAMRSSLLKIAPDVVPPTEELEMLYTELKDLKNKTLERARKAGEDLKTIHESMRLMKEKEKGKAKAIERVKRERDSTPFLDGDDARLSNSLHPKSSKPRLTSHPTNTATSVISTSARSSLDARRFTAEDLKKKKKRKRENDDSDQEPDTQRPRKATPPVAHHPSVNQHPKAQKSVITASQPQAKSAGGPDFTLPQTQSLVPPRPPIPQPPIPGPSRPTEVTEDFSKLKQPAQTLITTFYTSIEPWIRGIREEDVGFLEYTGDEIEPYIMPKLGRHYLEVWEDQDAGLMPLISLGQPQLAPPETFAAPHPKWDPSTLTEQDLLTEDRGHGPLTERVISALLPMPDVTVWKGVKAAEDAMEGRPGGSGAAAARKERLNVTELEIRIRDTMRFHGLLDGMPNFTEKVDDPIATALRHAQRELRTVVATNKARKERLAAIARDRLGYQEYLELRDSIDKNINSLYQKLQNKDVPKLSKKKKKPPGTAVDNDAIPTPAPCPAALGLIVEDEHILSVNEKLRQLVETRRKWVDTVGAVFEAKQAENPGRIWGLPKESIYKGIEEEIQVALRGSTSACTSVEGGLGGSPADEGKATVGDTATDIG